MGVKPQGTVSGFLRVCQQQYIALAMTVRDEIMQRRANSRGVRKNTGSKKVYYLSAEFLVGRALHNNMVNLVNEGNYAQALKELGIDRDAIFEIEPEPGLGNGGLGRLAACFLDSLTTLQLPAMGCTEPIAVAYCAAIARETLGETPLIKVGSDTNIRNLSISNVTWENEVGVPLPLLRNLGNIGKLYLYNTDPGEDELLVNEGTIGKITEI